MRVEDDERMMLLIFYRRRGIDDDNLTRARANFSFWIFSLSGSELWARAQMGLVADPYFTRDWVGGR